jgi:hypothetical protein
MILDMDILFTQLFRDLVKRLDEKDIINLCKTNKRFADMCKIESNFIRRELRRRVFYVQLKSDPDEIENDWVHNVKITKKRPVEMYGDFVETKRFESRDYPIDVSEMYVVFHFTDYNTDELELFVDKKQAEQFFNNGVSKENGQGIYEGDEDETILYYTVYDDDDNYANSRWVIQRVKVEES